MPPEITSKQLTRYDTDRDGDEYATDTGPYVHYTDAQAEIERLSRQVGLLQKSRDEYYEAYWKLKNSGHETKSNASEMRAVPQTLVDPLMLAAESILSEEHSKIIDESWETAPVRRLRKALNNLQTYRSNSNATIDDEWERAKDAMTGEPACDGCRRGFPKNEHGQHIWPSGIGGGDLRACKAAKASVDPRNCPQCGPHPNESSDEHTQRRHTFSGLFGESEENGRPLLPLCNCNTEIGECYGSEMAKEHGHTCRTVSERPNEQ